MSFYADEKFVYLFFKLKIPLVSESLLYEYNPEHFPTPNNLVHTIPVLPKLWSFHVEIMPLVPNTGASYLNVIQMMANGGTVDNMAVYGNRMPSIYFGPNRQRAGGHATFFNFFW